MSASDFFNRWSRRKIEAAKADADSPASDAAADVPATADSAQKALPTIADVANLTPESDYSAFLAKGVDEDVKRSALRKLFADPHFNVMDGLDTYIDDYSRPDPIPAAMLAALNHAKDLLDPLRMDGSHDASVKTLMALVDPEPPASEAQQIAQAAKLPPISSPISSPVSSPAAASTGKDGGPPSSIIPLPDTAA